MTKEQFIYDCLVALPELYDRMATEPGRETKLQEFADEHELDFDTVLNIATGWYNYAQVFEIVDERYGVEEPRVIRLPEGLRVIPEYTFLGDRIESVYIPKSVKKIEHHAFGDCYSLRSVVFPERLLFT